MKRRAFFAALAGVAPAAAAERFGEFNGPRCAVCHTTFSLDVPAYRPVVEDVWTAEVVTLVNARLLVCQECGTVKAVAA